MNILRRAANAFKDAMFPSKCFVCGSFFIHPPPTEMTGLPLGSVGRFAFPDLMTSFLCHECRIDFSFIESPMCSTCGKAFETREGDDHECEDCITSSTYFTTARAAGVFDQSLMSIIHQLKYKGKIQLARPLGKLLFSTLLHFWDHSTIDVVVPVPLHKRRFKKRGFNQAYLLIKDWEMLAGKATPMRPSLSIDTGLLLREKSTKPQTGLSRKERVKNIKNAFTVPYPDRVKGRRVLVVDDVYTTGATTNECARILLKHGAKHVDVLTLARAV